MAKINYYLKGIPSQQTLEHLQKKDRALYQDIICQAKPLICSISFDGRREIISTQLSIGLQFWDAKKQELKTGKNSPANRKKINESLAEKKKKICELIEDAQLQNIYVERKQLAAFFTEEKLDEDLEILESVFKRFKAEHRTSDGFEVKYKTLQKYNTLMNQMKKFQGDDRFIPNRITNEWVTKFKKYLLDRKINDNSIAKYITTLKTFKKYLLSIGIKLPAALELLKVVEKDQIVNILEGKELEILEQFKFESIFHSQVRDVLLFKCYTGQRYSDIEQISKACITTKDEYVVWLLSTQKTDDNLVVPLNKKAIVILDKYKHLETPLPRFTNQYFNRILKEVAKAAELNRIVKTVCFYNNQKKEITMPLHEAISSHMARKSFISLSTQKGIPERFVRDISGHKSERSFKKYLNLGNSHLEAILKAWN
jgi:site-specific recombinase XerD